MAMTSPDGLSILSDGLHYCEAVTITHVLYTAVCPPGPLGDGRGTSCYTLASQEIIVYFL